MGQFRRELIARKIQELLDSESMQTMTAEEKAVIIFDEVVAEVLEDQQQEFIKMNMYREGTLQ